MAAPLTEPQPMAAHAEAQRSADALNPLIKKRLERIEKGTQFHRDKKLLTPDFVQRNIYYHDEYSQILAEEYESTRMLLTANAKDPAIADAQAAQIALKIASRVMEERIQGETDPVTKKLNRRGLIRLTEKLIDEMLLLPPDQRGSITLTEGDINGLKIINDTKGHEAGDEIIEETGGVMDETSFRTTMNLGHISGRYGGDEMRRVDPYTAVEDVQRWFSRAQPAFKERGISIGLGTVEILPEELEGKTPAERRIVLREKIGQADTASYAAKALAKQHGVSQLLTADHPLAIKQLEMMRAEQKTASQ